MNSGWFSKSCVRAISNFLSFSELSLVNVYASKKTPRTDVA
jgi:hypothetical protein